MLSRLKTTVCIPCYGPHFKYIDKLVNAYNNQTIKPDEIVIAVSEWHSGRPKITPTTIPLIIVTSPERLFAGVNRNITVENSTGDLTIFNDADDLPCNKRVEIIKKVFETHPNTHMVVHNCIWNQNVEEFLSASITLDDVIIKPFKLDQIDFAAGPVSIKRAVFDNVKWTNKMKSQDVDFVKSAYQYCAQNSLDMFYIQNAIYLYRQKLSSRIEQKVLYGKT